MLALSVVFADDDHEILRFILAPAASLAELCQELMRVPWVVGGGGVAPARYWPMDSQAIRRAQSLMIKDEGVIELLCRFSADHGQRAPLVNYGLPQQRCRVQTYKARGELVFFHWECRLGRAKYSGAAFYGQWDNGRGKWGKLVKVAACRCTAAGREQHRGWSW